MAFAVRRRSILHISARAFHHARSGGQRMTEHEIDKASSFGAVRARLIALAYRMLGSRAEAEDIV
jgi:DNA-directed RNA polymerase specialized sigma24 family protein